MENKPANLEVSKQFDCPKETLYKAWTEPEQLKQWWKPMGKQLTDVSNNITEGGDVNYTFEDNSLTIDGRYEKVVDHELLEYTWNWHLASQPGEGTYKLSVGFSGDENKAQISITQEGFSNVEAILPHKQGWEQGLQQLHDFLSNRQNNAGASDGGNSGENLTGQQKPPITGYNETPEQLKVAGG